MRTESMRITSRGMLARQEAGIRGNTIIVNLPGSKKAALECFGAVASALKHGVEMLLGSATIEGGVKKADGAFEPDHV